MAINFRTIDGSGNNLSHPEFNAVGSAVAQSVPHISWTASPSLVTVPMRG